MDKMSQKSYKQHILDESLKNGIVVKVENPKGEKYQELYYCKICHSQQPKVKSHMLEHVVCQKHNMSVAKLKKPSTPQAPPPLQYRITMLEMENESLKEKLDEYEKMIVILNQKLLFPK